MVDYSKMSDFEINNSVAISLGAKVTDSYRVGEERETVYYELGGNEFAIRRGFGNINDDYDPCNNPADAWPIIVDSKISLHHSICKWDADSLVYDKKYKNGFFIFSSCSDIGDISSRGALRAAMIVFLMMQDANHG
jgi:hypothetical protein